MIWETGADKISSVLLKIPEKIMKAVCEVSMDMAAPLHAVNQTDFIYFYRTGIFLKLDLSN
jgi:hypothetical protein